MSKFTSKAKTIAQEVATHPAATTNYEGGLAFEMDAKTKLYTMSCTALLSDRFYVSEEDSRPAILDAIKEVGETDPKFLLQLAVYLRNEMYLRSMPVMLLVEATQHTIGTGLVREYAPRILKRADEPREAIGYWVSRFGDVGSDGPEHTGFSSLKKGIADTLPNFDAYQLAKYWGKGKDVTMRDVLRIARPKPEDDEQSTLWGMTVDNELPAPDTWEVYLSTQGKSKETWETILPKMGIMAKIRNLRNLLQNDVDEMLLKEHILAPLADPKVIAKSKQLPFRWYSAYRALDPSADPVRNAYGFGVYAAPEPQGVGHLSYGKVLDALKDAIVLSIQNVPRMPGRTFVTADNSGSMNGYLSERSTIAYWEVSNLLASMANEICEDSLVSVFGTRHVVVPIRSGANLFDSMYRMRKTDTDWNTNAYLAIRYLIENKMYVNRVLLFSDMQCYDSRRTGNRFGGASLSVEWEAYKRMCSEAGSATPYLYSIDLAGYGTAQFQPDDPTVAVLAGWSDKIFNFIAAFEGDKKQAVERIQEAF